MTYFDAACASGESNAIIYFGEQQAAVSLMVFLLYRRIGDGYTTEPYLNAI